MSRFVISLLVLLACCGVHAREDSLTTTDLKAARAQLALKVGAEDAALFTVRGSATGCHELEPCTEIVDRYAAFEHTVVEPNPLVTRTTIVFCRTPPKKPNWSCGDIKQTFKVPSLDPNPFFINNGMLNRESAALDDDTVVALVRYATSSCYAEQKADVKAQNKFASGIPIEYEKRVKFSAIGFDQQKNVYTISQFLGFWMYTMSVKPTDSGDPCPFKIVGFDSAVF